MIIQAIKDNVAFVSSLLKTQKEFHVYLKKHMKSFYQLLAIIFFLAIANTALIWFLGRPFEYLVSGDYEGLVDVLIILFFIIIISQTLHYLDDYHDERLGLDYITEIRTHLLDQYVNAPTLVTEKYAKGNLISRLLYDVYSMRSFIVSLPLDLASHLFTIFFYSGMLIYIDWKLALLTALLSPLFFVHQKIFSKKKREAAKKYYQENAILLGKEDEIIGNLRVINAFNCQERLRSQHGSFLKKMMIWAKKEKRLDALFSSSLSILIYFCALFIVFQGIDGIESETLTISNLVSYLLYMGYMSVPIRGITRLFFQAQSNSVVADRLRPFIGEVQREDTNLKEEFVADKGNIIFDRVSWSVGDTKVIKDLSFNIQAGSTVAFVGGSGAGKSTVANLLMGFIRPDSGSIIVDKQNLNELTVTAIRSEIGIVWQSPMLFDDTIKNNLLLANPTATNEMIEVALHDSDAESFVVDLVDGIETKIGADGVQLSAGQKQRLHIAQAFLRNSEILIMDEATSALDSESEQKLVQNIKRIRKGRTTILIAHRYSSLRYADYIVYLNADGTVDTGTHEELLAKHVGYEQALNWQSGF